MRPGVTTAHVAYLAPLALFVGIYGTGAGHGFVKDDFGWIVYSRIRTVQDLNLIFTRDAGFYRPLVSLTFSINEWFFGAQPLGYGLTNVALALACFVLIVFLGRSLRLPFGAAWLAASIWLLNFHFIRMGVLWISGRTSLLVTLFCTAAATALVRGSLSWTLICVVAAFLTKEEAALIPVVLSIWLILLGRRGFLQNVSSKSWLIGLVVVCAAYFGVRSQVVSWTPWSAPDFYVYDFRFARLAANAVEFADRSSTLAVAVIVLTVLVLGPPVLDKTADTNTIVACGFVWLVLAFGPTILLPVRSDLYACLPAVGSCLIAGAICSTSWLAANCRRRQRALFVAVLFVLLVSPVHYLRTSRWVRPADFSTLVLNDLERFGRTLPDDATVVLDEGTLSEGPRLGDTFGVFLNEAYFLRTGKRLTFWVEPPLADAVGANLRRPCPTCRSLRLVVTHSGLQPSR